MKKRTKLIIAAAAVTIILTVVTALATGGYLYPLNNTKDDSYLNDVIPDEAAETLEALETPEISEALKTTQPSDSLESSKAPDEFLMTYPEYIQFSGKIIEINHFYENDKLVEGKYFVLAENEDGGLMNFRVDSDTVLLTENELTVGATVIGYYDATLPMIMIYPPQAHADVLAVDFPADMSLKVDRFDENLVSADEELKLNIGDNTELQFANGSPASASDLPGSRLAVVYSITTRSIPAQTTPDTVVILNESPIYE